MSRELLSEFPGVILPWLSTELVVKLRKNLNEADVQSQVRNSRRKAHQSSIHYTANQRPGNSTSQSRSRHQVIQRTPSWQTRALNPKPKSGLLWIQLTTAQSALTREPRMDVLNGVPSITGTGGDGTVLVDLYDRGKHSINQTRQGPDLRVVIEDIFPSLTEINKRLPSPILLDGIREVWKPSSISHI
jgi:hypothetical protein